MIKEHWFDMDHTLIDNDCDVSWKEFLVDRKLAPANAMELAAKFYEDYKAGTLDEAEFTRFQLAEFKGRTVEEMQLLAMEHFRKVVKHKIYPGAFLLLQELRDSGTPTAILTSTNTVVAAPVARYFGVTRLLGTELEVVDGRYSGEYTGIYAVGPGKVELARIDLAKRDLTPEAIAYYGDSINDRFILAAAGRAYAVNADTLLTELASANNWQQMSFRD